MDGLDRPFAWTASSGATVLPLAGHNRSAARPINDADQILGSRDAIAVISEADVTVREASSIGGQPVSPVGINGFGNLASWGPAGAFRWSPQTGSTQVDAGCLLWGQRRAPASDLGDAPGAALRVTPPLRPELVYLMSEARESALDSMPVSMLVCLHMFIFSRRRLPAGHSPVNMI